MFEDDEDEEREQTSAAPAASAAVSAAERIEDVEENFYAGLSRARFRFTPARTDLRAWAFFAVYAAVWLVLLVVYIYTAVRYTRAWLVIVGLIFLAGSALGGVFLIRGAVFYYYDMYVCRVGREVVNLFFPRWNRDVIVYFSRDRILRAHKGAVEERKEYAYQYVGTHLLFNKFNADVKYMNNNMYETITAVSRNNGTARMRILNDLPASVTYVPAPSLRSEFGAVKYLRLAEYKAREPLPALPECLVRECELRGWKLPEGFPVAEKEEKRRRAARAGSGEGGKPAPRKQRAREEDDDDDD